jgi:hypothetical protein
VTALLRRARILALIATATATAACGDDPAAPAGVGRSTFALVAIDGAALPVVYAQTATSAARIYADTLVLTPRSTREGTYAEIAVVGLTEAGGSERRQRIEQDPLRAYVAVGADSLEVITVGGPARGLVPRGDSLVLLHPLRGQRWRYRRVP